MIRHAAAVAIVMCLSPASLFAQRTVFTVKVSSADVYKTPSTGSPIIGHASRGAVLEVTRELGSWVKISWPTAQDGFGYVHVSMGSLEHGAALDATGPAESKSAAPAREPQPRAPDTTLGRQISQPPSPLSTRQAYVTPSAHFIGFGAQVGGSTFGFGASARAWRHDRLGVQVAFARYGLSSAETPGNITAIQFEPSVLYSMKNFVSDHWWLRPYAGSGVTFSRTTVSSAIPGALDSMSDSEVGVQVFGGSEVTFANVPQFALSAGLGYHWVRTPFAGVDLGGLGLSVSGHWYVK